MSNSIYGAIARQTGLLAEMQIVANNIANLSTTGYRREGLVFSEHIHALEGPAGSLSAASAGAHVTFDNQGALRRTESPFDLAIEGPGFFMIMTPEGERLTRAGAFSQGSDGTLVTPDGHQVLDPAGAAIFVPSELGPIAIAGDGTVSAGGDPIGQIGIYLPVDPLLMTRENGVRFNSPSGVEAFPEGRVLQGFVEGSNVNPVVEIARMIEVQRAYELGQTFIEQEDKRIGSVIQSAGRS